MVKVCSLSRRHLHAAAAIWCAPGMSLRSYCLEAPVCLVHLTALCYPFRLGLLVSDLPTNSPFVPLAVRLVLNRMAAANADAGC